MEIRRDEEEEEKEEEIEEESEEEEKKDSQEVQKESQKIHLVQNDSIKNQNQEEEKYIKIQNTPKKQIEEIDNQELGQNKEDDIQEEQDLEATSTYILKYIRKGDELKEMAIETGLRKSENCLFMLNIKLIKSDSVSIINTNEEFKENETPKEPENFLVFCCHEIAAIYFDEIYERIYTLKDLAGENKYFKVFESTEEAKTVIDETIRTNEKNAKKIFIGFKDKELKLHMKLSFFDKEEEIVLNIPKKPLTDEDKVNLLPEFLKEIQDKMNHLNEENKKLKAKKLSYSNKAKESKFIYNKNNILNDSIEIGKEKKEKDKNNNSNIQINEFISEENNNININNNNNNTINNNIVNNNIVNNNNNNISNNNVSNGNNIIHKKVKKGTKIKKRHLKPEENFF